MNNLRLILSFVVVAAFAYCLTPVVAEEATPPQFCISQLDRDPVIDGNLDDPAWAGATELTGMVGNVVYPTLLPESLQTRWWIGFRANMLYFAMRSPIPPGTNLMAKIRTNDNQEMYQDDTAEIQILTHQRDEATKPGKGFYKLMINPRGALWDRHFYNGTPDSEDIWSMGGKVASEIKDGCWNLEVSIDSRSMNLAGLADKNLVIQLVRNGDSAGGVYYNGLVGANYASWKKFASVRTDAAAPAFRLNQLGEIMAGNLDAKIKVRPSTTSTGEVVSKIIVTDPEGKVLYEDVKRDPLAAGKSVSQSFSKSGLPVGDVPMDSKERNHLSLETKWIDGGKETVLFQNTLPFMKLTPEWVDRYVTAALAGRPKVDWDLGVAYLPYSGVVLINVDADVLGLPEKFSKARAIRVELRSSKNGKVLAKSDSPLVGGAASWTMKSGFLADGNYEVTAHLLGQKDEIATKKILFERKTWPFEKNKLGTSGEVIPPFFPIAIDAQKPTLGSGRSAIPGPAVASGGHRLALWGTAYDVMPGGWPAQIWTAPPSGSAGTIQPLLESPIQLLAAVDGREIEFRHGPVEVVTSTPDRVDLSSSSSGGGFDVQVNSFLEYDGWFEAKITLNPKGSVALDHLDLIIPLRDLPAKGSSAANPVDTLMVQRMGGGLDNSYMGSIPRKAGIAYQSTELLPAGGRAGPADVPKDWKSFVPETYIGNGDRGLWVFAWSDKGWTLRDGDAAVTVERLADGNARLRLRMIAGPETIDKPRTLSIALQASPMKPNQTGYRTFLRNVVHDTSGFRYYGDSVDAFNLHTEEDFSELRKFLLYGTTRQSGPNPAYDSWFARPIATKLREGTADRLMMYGSQWMTGLGSPEFSSFGGEWLGRNNWTPSPDVKFNGRWNYGRTVEWKTPNQLSAVRVNWPQSFVDFFVWYHLPLITKAGFNGTWWDNSYAGTVTEYDPETKMMDSTWNLRMRRDLCKRLNVVGWENMRPPFWGLNTQTQIPWCQLFWMVEGFWGPDAPDIFATEKFRGVDFFRAAARNKSSMMVTRPSYLERFKGSTPEKDLPIRRNLDALMLLHDLAPINNPELLRTLEYRLDFSNDAECLFSGYWQTQPDDGGPIKVSSFSNVKRKAWAFTALNITKEPAELKAINAAPLPGWLKEGPGAGGNWVLKDLESDQVIECQLTKDGIQFTQPIPLGAGAARHLIVLPRL